MNKKTHHDKHKLLHGAMNGEGEKERSHASEVHAIWREGGSEGGNTPQPTKELTEKMY